MTNGILVLLESLAAQAAIARFTLVTPQHIRRNFKGTREMQDFG
jgi:hypothetical protein